MGVIHNTCDVYKRNETYYNEKYWYLVMLLLICEAKLGCDHPWEAGGICYVAMAFNVS